MEEEGVSSTPMTGAGGGCAAAQGNPTREDDRSSNPRPTKRQRGQGEEGDEEKEAEGEGEGEGKGEEEKTEVGKAWPTLPSWRLREDACAHVKRRRNGMEDAGRRMFEDARQGEGLTDMEFVLDSGERVRGHKVWLMARCEYIQRMMEIGMQEGKTGVVAVRGCGDGSFFALLEFLYTGRIGDTCLNQEWGEMWELADVFLLEEMKEALLDGVTAGNVYEAVRFAVETRMVQLKDMCIKALPSKPASRDEAGALMRAVDALSQCGDENEWMADGKVIGAVVGAMGAYRDDALVQEKGCAALERWSCSSDENRELVLGADGIKATVAGMKGHTISTAIQDKGCTVLTKLCNTAKNRRSGGAAGAVEAVVEGIKAHTSNARVQEAGCGALLNICYSDAENQGRYEAAGGLEAVVEAVQAHASNTQIQELGCRILASAKFVRYTSRSKVMEAGGIEAVVGALQAHPSNFNIQEQGCAVLANLVGVSRSDVNSGRAGAAGGVEAVVKALREHASVTNIQEQGCAALASLCTSNPTNVTRTLAAGGAELVVEVLETHAGNPNVQCHAIEVLGILVRGHGADSQRVGAAGGVEAVVKAMTTDSSLSNLRVQVAGCDSLRDLCDWSDGFSRRAGAAGGVKAIVEALKAHASDSKLQKTALQTLFNILLQCNENCPRAAEAGAVIVVQAAMRDHANQGELIIYGRAILRILGVEDLAEGEAEGEAEDASEISEGSDLVEIISD